MKHYYIRKIRNQQELEKVYQLTHDSLVRIGDLKPLPEGKLISYPHLDQLSDTTILVAIKDGEIIGTNSIVKENPCGLNTDKHFKNATDEIRKEKRILCSSFRIATKVEYKEDPCLLMDLTKETVRTLIVEYNFQTCLFTFNPRHENFYKLYLGAETVVRKKNIGDENIQASAILMRWDIEKTSGRMADIVKYYTQMRKEAEGSIFRLYPETIKKVA